MKRFIKNESDAVRKGHEPGTSSFVISSFMTSGFDEETGELFKDDWSASYEVAKLKSYFNYRQCFISRMPEETSVLSGIRRSIRHAIPKRIWRFL